MNQTAQKQNWEAALEALMRIAEKYDPARQTEPEKERTFLERVADRIKAASPMGLTLKGYPWAKYGFERVYIHVLDEDGKCLESGLFWEAGRLGWRFCPENLPSWYDNVRAALANIR